MARLILALRVFDALLVFGALWVSTWMTGAEWTSTHTAAGLLAAGLYSLLGEVNGVYGPWRGTPMKSELLQTWASFVLVIPGLLLVGYFANAHAEISHATTAVWLFLTPAALVLTRASLRLSLQEIRRHGLNTRRVAIAGATEGALRLAHSVTDTPWSGLRIHGFYDDRLGPGGEPIRLEETSMSSEDDQHRVVAVPAEFGQFRGDFEALVADARAGRVDIVYIALPLRAEGRIRNLVAELADTTATVHVVADVLLSELMQARFSSVGDVPVISVFDTPFHGVDGTLKRIEDIVLGSVILSIIAIPMLIIAAAVKLTSKGPVFFRQRRYGLNGQEIFVLKFRSMTVAEDGDVVKQATKNDARITKVGAFLRRTSLDELPQFLNVLSGEMSIVGPRPHAVAHNEQYRRLIPGYMLRHKVKPGITGWAQVNGWRGETDTLGKMVKRVEHDLAYIRDWGLWLDLKIIFLTVFGNAARKNAY